MKRKYIIKIMYYMGILLSALCLMSCTQKTREPKISIDILHSYGSLEDSSMREIYKEFETIYPDIEINLVSVTSSKRVAEKARDMLAVGRIPDIIYIADVEGDNLYKFMRERNDLLNLEPYIKAEGFWQEEFLPYVMEGDETGIYHINNIIKVKGYWYNKKIFENAGIENPPGTWEEFYEVCKKIDEWAKEEGLSTKALEFTKTGMMNLYEVLSMEKTKAYALMRLKELLTDMQIEEVDSTYKTALRSFNVGHTAIYISDLSEREKLSKNMDFGFMPLPSFSGKSYLQISAPKGYMLSKLGSSKEQEASILFLQYLLSKETSSRILYQTQEIPNNSKFVSLVHNGYQTFMELSKTGEYGKIEHWDIEKYHNFMEYSEEFFFGELKIDEFLSKIR